VAAPEAPPPLFNTLALDPKLLRAVVDSGYTAMTPIQAKAIPRARAWTATRRIAQLDVMRHDGIGALAHG
jgi:superfamily II DNA/RNA helicase